MVPLLNLLVARDFADSDDSNGYPAHGWAANTQGRRVLWLPLLPLVANPWAYRGSKGLPDDLPLGKPNSPLTESRVYVHPGDREPWGVDADVRLVTGPPSAEPLRSSLVNILMALGQTARSASEIRRLAPEADPADVYAMNHWEELALFCVKAAVLELRVFLDLLAFHLVPVLFREWKHNRPETLPTLIQRVSDAKPAALLVDKHDLSSILASSWDWFSILRARDSGDRGLRDQLVHKNCRLIATTSSSNSGPFELSVSLTPVESAQQGDVLGALRKMLRGLCLTCQALASLCGLRGFYSRQDAYMLTMHDEHQAEFWPALRPPT